MRKLTAARLTAALTAVALAASGVALGLATPASADPTYDTTQPVAPVLSYTFDKDNGTVAVDSSGNGNNGTLKAPTGQTPSYVAGVSGQALAISNGTKYVKLPLVAGKTDGSTSFSFEFWINEQSRSSYGSLFSNQNFAACTNNGMTLFNQGTAGKFQACWNGTGGGSANYLTSSVTASQNAWHQVAGVVDTTSKTMTIYVDGAAAGSKTTSSMVLNSGLAFNLGGLSGSEADSGDGYTNASVDDLNFYNATITPTQIAADYAATNPATHFPVTVTSGGHGTGTSSVLAPASGQAVTLSATPATGYHLASWTPVTPASLTINPDGSFTGPGSPVTVNATFAPAHYTVHFDGNGAAGGSMPDQALTYDQAATLTANGFVKAGYQLAGWSTTPTGAVAYTDAQSVTNLTTTDGATVTLYARWVPTGSHAVTVSGDAHVTVSSSATATGYAVTGDTVTLTATPATGYHYVWQTTPADLPIGSDNTFTMPNSDVSIQAVSAPNAYTVHFDGNGADGGATADQAMTYGQAAALTTDGYTKAGYQFAGWATSATGAAAYTNGQSVSNLAASGTVTLYAVWGRLRAGGDTAAPYLSYDFDTVAGTTVADSSGQHHDAAWSGTPTYTTGLGGQGKAIHVEGSAGTVLLPLVNGKTDGSGNFSVVFWYGGDSFTGDAWMFSNNTGGSCDRGFNLYHNSSTGAPTGCFGTTIGGTKQYQAFPSSLQGAWHQIAGVVDRTANTVTWYADGVQVAQSAAGSMTASTSFVTGLPFALGQNGSLSYGNDDTAWFDDLDFYTSAITPAQIQNDYNATKPASTALPTLPGGGGTTTTATGFLTDTFHAPEVRVGGTVSQPVGGLWTGDAVTSYTKVDGDSWLSVGADGIVTGTAPASAPEDPGTITVEATDGTSTDQITVEVPVIGADEPAQADTATWNLWDAGTHVDDSLDKDLTVIAANGLDVVGLQEDGGDVARQLADALGWNYSEGSGTGLGIVSAYPIGSQIPDTADTPALGVSIDVLGQDTQVWSVGLDPADSTNAARQFQAITGELQAVGTPPMIVMADLESSSLAAGTSGLLDDSFREANPDATAVPGDTLLFASPSDRVDYVYYLGDGLDVLGSNTLVAGWPTAADPASAWTSDHAAVVTTFAIGSGTTNPTPTAPTATLAHGSATYQVGHGPAGDAALLGDLGASASDGATLEVATDADYTTAGDYTATVTATHDGVTSDPALAVVHVVPVVHVTLSHPTASLVAGSVSEAAVLAATGASLNVTGQLHVDVSGATSVGAHTVTVTGTDTHGFADSAQATLTVTTDPNAPVTVTGTVTSGGSPVSGACVYLYPGALAAGATYATCTGADGSFSLAGVTPGAYTVGVADPSGANLTWWSAAPVSFGSGSAPLAIAMTPATTEMVSGTVSDASGPVAGACVYLYAGAAGPASYATCTGADGSYWIGGVATSSTYRVAVSDPSGVHQTQWWTGTSGGAGSYAGATALTNAPGATITASLTLAAAANGSVAGTVTGTGGTPVGGACVYLYAHGDATAAKYATCAQADGSYWIGGIAAGVYDVAFFDPSGTYATKWDTTVTVAHTTVSGTDAQLTPVG